MRYMTKGEWSGWKRKLTNAKKKGPDAVIAVCDTFLEQTDVVLPDDWAHFQRAKDDAMFAQKRQGIRTMGHSW